MDIEAVEVEQRDDLAAHYFYDYQEERLERIERIRNSRILERREKERKIKSSIKYKFESLPKEDQWAVIGGITCLIILITLG